jgi:NADH-quinone oxidoreductase subunit J
MVTTQKLVRSLLLHVVTLSLIGLVYLSVGAGLMGSVQVMVYAGSVSILLVFALMFTPVGEGAAEALDHQAKGRAIVAAAGIVAVVGYALLSASGARELIHPAKVETVAKSLFVTHVYPFELLSVVLLVALAGVAVVGATGRRGPEEWAAQSTGGGDEEPA